jgi:hypothetical protein
METVKQEGKFVHITLQGVKLVFETTEQHEPGLNPYDVTNQCNWLKRTKKYLTRIKNIYENYDTYVFERCDRQFCLFDTPRPGLEEYTTKKSEITKQICEAKKILDGLTFDFEDSLMDTYCIRDPESSLFSLKYEIQRCEYMIKDRGEELDKLCDDILECLREIGL